MKNEQKIYPLKVEYYIYGLRIKYLGLIKILFVWKLNILFCYIVSNTVLCSSIICVPAVLDKHIAMIGITESHRWQNFISNIMFFFITKSSEMFYIHISTCLSILSQDAAYVLLWNRCIIMLCHWNMYWLNIPTTSLIDCSCITTALH